MVAWVKYVETEIKVADVGGRTAVVSVHGELDLSGADAFREALADGTIERRPRVVVDLVDATFIDSTALGIIVGASKRVAGAGGQLSVAASDPRILRVFQLTGLDRSIRIEKSLAEAIG
jgi:anti-sigma B factor antagonist